MYHIQSNFRQLRTRTSVLIAFVLLMLLFPGCGEKSPRVYRSGNLWVVNNLCPEPIRGRWLKVVWDGEELDIPNNMNTDGSSTGAGAVMITSELLPGGTPVDFEFVFRFADDLVYGRLSAELDAKERLIDGDITVDMYSHIWNPAAARIETAASVISGRCDAIHNYPDI